MNNERDMYPYCPSCLSTANGVADGIVITVEHDDAAVQRNDDDGVRSAVDINSVGENTDNSDVFTGVAGVGKDDGRRPPNEGDGMTIRGQRRCGGPTAA